MKQFEPQAECHDRMSDGVEQMFADEAHEHEQFEIIANGDSGRCRTNFDHLAADSRHDPDGWLAIRTCGEALGLDKVVRVAS